MATYQLHLNAQKIDEALSGAYLALIDAHGFTGDLNIQGDSYHKFFHADSGAIRDFFVVSGDQTGHGILSNKHFVDFKNISVTGDSYFSSITGSTSLEQINVSNAIIDTAYLPSITGSTHFNGDVNITGGSLNFTGENINLSGDALLSGLSHIIYGDVAISGSLDLQSNFVTDYEIQLDNDFHITGEIFISGNRIQDVLTNTVEAVITGDFNLAFQDLGDLLVGTGVSGASILSAQAVEHGYVLTRDTGSSLGLSWLSQTGAAAAAGGGGLEHFESYLDSNWVGIKPTGVRDGVIISGSSLVVCNKDFNANLIGSNSIAINVSNITTRCDSSNSIVLGSSRIFGEGFDYGLGEQSSVYNIAIGEANYLEGGRYNTQLGHNNNQRLGSSDYSFIGGYLNTTSGSYDILIGSENTVDAGGYESELDQIYSSIIMIGKSNQSLINDYGDVSDGDGSIIVGNYNNILNTGSFVFGKNNRVNQGLAIGLSNTNTGIGNITIGYHGINNRDYSLVTSFNTGHQINECSWGGTTNNTTGELKLAGVSQFGVSGSAATLSLLTVARRTDGGGNEAAGFEHKCVLKNNSGTLSMVGKSEVSNLSDNANWGMDLFVVDDRLQITVTGEASKTIDWRTAGYFIEY